MLMRLPWRPIRSDRKNRLPASNRVAGLAFAALFALTASVSASEPTTIKVAIRGGVDEQIFEVVTRVAAKDGVVIEPIVINGTISPNEALSNGDVNANSFQHIPFMNNEIKNRGYKIIPVANTYLSLLAFYSAKYKSLDQLPSGARIGLPSDISNQTRALLLLQTHGAIKLRPGIDPLHDSASVVDIVDNPRKFTFVELSMVVLSKSYQDLDAAAFVNSFASQVGLLATRDGIAVERKESSPYVNVIAVRPADKDQRWLGQLITAYQSDEVRSFILKEFNGAIVPLF